MTPHHTAWPAAALAAAVLALPIAAGAGAVQPHNNTPPGTVPFGKLAFEIDYATAGAGAVGNTKEQVDTLVSIGLASNAAAPCNVQVAWYDSNGAPAGFSGDNINPPGISLLNPGETLEFTTASNNAFPFTYYPFEQNVFRSTAAAFEGHAAIFSDCGTEKLRADAEFVTLTTPSGASAGTVNYKVINISKPTGITGY